MTTSPPASIAPTLLAVLIAAFATAAVLLIAVFSSPGRRDLGDAVRSSLARPGVRRVQGRSMLGLVPLGVISGIPIALGLIPANSFVLIAAISACMIGRGLFRGEGQAAASVAPFLAISWSILAGLQRFDTLDIGAAMGAQGVFGPFAGFASHPWTWALFPIGLLAAPLWVVQLPRIGGGDHVALDRLFGIGETALSAVAVSGPLWGPSLGALVYGPLDSNAFAASATSFLVTLMFVGLVTRFKDFVPRQYALGWALAGLGLAVLVVSEVAG